MTKAGNGQVAAFYAADLARNDPIIVYAASREFADDHPDVIKAFRAAIEEAAPIVNSDREIATQSIAKFTKMPIDLVRQTRPSVAKAELKGSISPGGSETMKQQDMLQGSPDLTKLVLDLDRRRRYARRARDPADRGRIVRGALRRMLVWASLRPRLVMALGRPLCERLCRGSPPADWLTRSASAAFECSRSHATTSPTSSASAASSSVKRSGSASRLATAAGRARSSRALHQLKRYIAENPKGFGEGEPAFDALHKRFHASLIAACGSPRLIAACARLYDEAYRYRRLMMASFKSPEQFVHSHEILAGAAITRATERAQTLAEAHIASTLALVYPEPASRELVNGSEPALIEFRGVDVAFGDHLVLGKLTLAVRRGEIVCVVGPSGCGKTTALRVASVLICPTRGEVAFAGAPIKGPRRDVAVVFQDYSKALLPWRTAAGNVALALEATGTPRAARPDRIAQLLTRVGLAAFAEKYPAQMSGGMQQRLQIARCLAQEPSALMMDEPFGALDAMTRQTLQDQILEIARRRAPPSSSSHTTSRRRSISATG